MNSKQKSTHTMFIRVNTFLTTNARIVSSLPNYSQYYAIVTSEIDKINELSKEQLLDKSGFNKTKKRLKLALAPIALDVSRKLKAYSIFTNLDVLQSEVSFTRSELKYAPDEELLKYSQAIHDRAQEHIAQLESYGITAETLTSLQSAITAFKESIPNASIEKASSKEKTALLASTIKSAEEALEKIDTAIEIIRLQEPQFYNEYKSLRKKVEMGKGSVVLKGSIIDALTKEPVRNATATFTIKENGHLATSHTNGSITKKSALKGGFYIKSMTNGIYNVVITKNGYTEQKATVAITNGELSRLKVELVRN